jgi:hypothetical protein
VTHAPERKSSEECQRLEAVLHLVIGSDLDEGELESARAHLAGCEACTGLARRARRARQVYFEQASSDGVEAPNLWPRLAAELSAAGLLGRSGAPASERADPLPRSPSGMAQVSEYPRLAPATAGGPGVGADAAALAQRPGPSASGQGASPSTRTWRLAAVALFGGGLAAAALLYGAGLVGQERPSDRGAPAGQVADLTPAQPPAAAGLPQASDPLVPPNPPAADVAEAPRSGGLRPIPASERLRLATQGFEYLEMLPGAEARQSGRETLVNLSYPR